MPPESVTIAAAFRISGTQSGAVMWVTRTSPGSRLSADSSDATIRTGPEAAPGAAPSPRTSSVPGFSVAPVLASPPEAVTEPFTVMLWGITTERIQDWLGAGEADSGASAGTNQLTGFAGSSGVVEGLARVVMSPDQIGTVEDGEVLVCPVTAPSWVPVFARIAGAVSDSGGIMCHAAIVAREYGLPAVVGTGYATKRIKTGQLLRVDGDTGIVTILDREVG